jgi:ATP-dependent phosphoenolpyruvate carboxykinase
LINRERAIDYLNTRPRLYVFDGYAGWDPKYRIKVRIVASRAYHILFMRNMLIRPTEEELEDFGTPDFTIFNAGEFPANRYTTGMTSTTSVSVNFKRAEMVILGSEYAGEMKKGVSINVVGKITNSFSSSVEIGLLKFPSIFIDFHCHALSHAQGWCPFFALFCQRRSQW